jgi:hypothetical protein
LPARTLNLAKANFCVKSFARAYRAFELRFFADCALAAL